MSPRKSPKRFSPLRSIDVVLKNSLNNNLSFHLKDCIVAFTTNWVGFGWNYQNNFTDEQFEDKVMPVCYNVHKKFITLMKSICGITLRNTNYKRGSHYDVVHTENGTSFHKIIRVKQWPVPANKWQLFLNRISQQASKCQILAPTYHKDITGSHATNKILSEDERIRDASKYCHVSLQGPRDFDDYSLKLI
jgi:hypothetical protein